ncbi:molybdenum ABC transporter ATP-binding protein [Cognatishimia sp. SS12]|uniref:molybdenum ABC transporter ATP-binding protein n=1 Tax=Cognatishimia sp. SS12 TaxID=2979465 RepID=UPI00232E98AE|nr:molybdenum ABC transporter ATP-binding protein [Cognatishimia sp. SS12]MDC0736682.1 molybdenum ABC transporter ATP-binding protein [Cognatishimia sp. SS12]
MSLQVAFQHRYPGTSLDVRFEAPQGITALFGPSGVGKTSVINVVAGLLRPDQGRIALGDRLFFDHAARVDLPTRKRRVGYVFQDHRLFPHMTVLQNLTYGRRAQRLPVQAADIDPVVQMLGLAQLLQRMPEALSGGETQRVAIGRALLAEPELLLLDEPLAALDQARRQEIMPYLERLRDQAAMPMLYVSHSVSEVARLATTVVAMKDGRVARVGPVAEVFADPVAADALGDAAMGAILSARVVAQHADGLTELAAAGGTLWLPYPDVGAQRNVTVRVRAQDVMLSLTRPSGISALNVLEGRIRKLHRREAGGVMVQLQCGNAHLLARITGRSAAAMALSEGDQVFAVVKTVAVAEAEVFGR